MAPTICSGKKRQTHTTATTNIRRHGQGNPQLNQTLSSIVNFVATGSVNPRASASLRIQNHKQTSRNRNRNINMNMNINTNTTGNYSNTTHEADLNYNRSMQANPAATSSSSCSRRQQVSFISDNAVTSSTHSDTENSFDLRLANESLSNDSAAAYGSSNTTNPSNATSPAPLSETSSSSSHKRENTSSPTKQCQQRFFQRYSTAMQQTNSEDDSSDSYENGSNNKEITHSSSNIRKHYFSCSNFDVDKEFEYARELNSDMSGGDGSDADMDTDESMNSMTSLDTEKSAKLKRGNHPLLRDKLLAEQQQQQQTDSHSNSSSSSNSNGCHKKSYTNTRNTDGLLSIAIKTIKLVKRNKLLQQRLTQLQLETSEFIQSVLANPENKHFRENIKQKVQVDNF